MEISALTIESLSSAYQAVTCDELRGLVVETVDGDQEDVMVDLRKLGTVYEYEFQINWSYLVILLTRCFKNKSFINNELKVLHA